MVSRIDTESGLYWLLLAFATILFVLLLPSGLLVLALLGLMLVVWVVALAGIKELWDGNHKALTFLALLSLPTPLVLVGYLGFLLLPKPGSKKFEVSSDGRTRYKAARRYRKSYLAYLEAKGFSQERYGDLYTAHLEAIGLGAVSQTNP